jgi:hypothetical protein
MKSCRNCVLAVTAAVALSAAAPFAFAIAGSVESPEVPFAADYPEEAKQKVRAALRREDSKFLRGFFVNWFTTLHYAGDTEALNLFIGDLLKCPGAKVSVGFKKLGEQGEWLVTHNSLENSFLIQINLDSEQVELEKLRLPAASGPELEGKKNDP